MLQVEQLHKEYDSLQRKFGDSSLSSIYGAGCTENPDIMFIFMNPTGRNISSTKNWKGIRAPWVSTKQVWDIFFQLNLLDEDLFSEIRKLKPQEWTIDFTESLYRQFERRGIYITNLAKCTQIDARPLKDSVFKEYLDLMFREIEIVNPKKIVSFGNQVSSILLGKKISVSNYGGLEKEILNGYELFPTYYPVGQGRRNMPLAVERIRGVMLQT